MAEVSSWIYCEACGKKLLKRMPNGIFIFKFGKTWKKTDVVYLEIFGSIKMKCFRENCEHVNIINFFPN